LERDIDVKFSRHAKGRMKLYDISEAQVVEVLRHGERAVDSAGRVTYLHKVQGFRYPIKVVMLGKPDSVLVLTAYPLKRGRR
jgi:hypothetical protein